MGITTVSVFGWETRSYFEHTTNNLIYLKMGKGEGWGEGEGKGAGEAEFKNGVFGCFNNLSNCMCGYFCLPCLFKQNAEKMGESGCFHCVLGCCVPFVGAYLQRKKLREDNNIDGEAMEDIGYSLCCSPCVAVQVANELNDLGK